MLASPVLAAQRALEVLDLQAFFALRFKPRYAGHRHGEQGVAGNNKKTKTNIQVGGGSDEVAQAPAGGGSDEVVQAPAGGGSDEGSAKPAPRSEPLAHGGRDFALERVACTDGTSCMISCVCRECCVRKFVGCCLASCVTPHGAGTYVRPYGRRREPQDLEFEVSEAIAGDVGR